MSTVFVLGDVVCRALTSTLEGPPWPGPGFAPFTAALYAGASFQMPSKPIMYSIILPEFMSDIVAMAPTCNWMS